MENEWPEWFLSNIPKEDEPGVPASKRRFQDFLTSALAPLGVRVHRVRFMHDHDDTDEFLGWGFASVEVEGGAERELNVLDSLKRKLHYGGRTLVIEKAKGRRREAPQSGRHRMANG